MDLFQLAISQWHDVGIWVSLIGIIILLGSFVFRTFLQEPISDGLVLRGILLNWVAIMTVYFGFPLFLSFSSLITIKVDNVAYLQAHPDETSVFEKIGNLSFSVLATTYILNIQVLN